MPNYDSTARVPFKHGGSVKKPKVKRIILGRWGPKAGKPWPGAKEAARQTRKKHKSGGKVIKTITAPLTHLRNWISARDFKKANKKRSKKAEGGKARDYKKELAEWNSPENRKKRQQEYIKKHGKPQPRRKRLATTDPYKKIREQRKFSEAGFKPLRAGKAKGGKAKDSVHQPTTHSWWLLNRNKRDKKAKGGKASDKKIKIESNISPRELFEITGVSGGTGKQNIEREKKYWAKKHKDSAKKFRESMKKEGPHKDEGVKPIAIKSTSKAEGGIISLKKGGKADKKWIQKATKGMRKDKPCTGKKFGSATCPPDSKRYNLAKTFKKMARSKHASGGLVRYI